MIYFIITILVFCAALYLYIHAARPQAIGSTAASLRTTGSYFREVVGESHYQDALSAIAGGKEVSGLEATADLVPEDDNKYDANAIRVEIEGDLVGYLPSEQARLYRGRLKRAKLPLQVYSCPASISGGGRKNYGVWLDLPDRLA